MIKIEVAPTVPKWVYEGVFPEADEDRLDALAQAWTGAARNSATDASELNTSFRKLGHHWEGPSAESAFATGSKVNQFLVTSGESADSLAKGCSYAAKAVRTTKLAMNQILASLGGAMTNIQTQVAANPLAVAPGLVAADSVQKAARAHLLAFKQALLDSLGGIKFDLSIKGASPAQGRGVVSGGARNYAGPAVQGLLAYGSGQANIVNAVFGNGPGTQAAPLAGQFVQAPGTPAGPALAGSPIGAAQAFPAGTAASGMMTVAPAGGATQLPPQVLTTIPTDQLIAGGHFMPGQGVPAGQFALDGGKKDKAGHDERTMVADQDDARGQGHGQGHAKGSEDMSPDQGGNDTDQKQSLHSDRGADQGGGQGAGQGGDQGHETLHEDKPNQPATIGDPSGPATEPPKPSGDSGGGQQSGGEPTGGHSGGENIKIATPDPTPTGGPSSGGDGGGSGSVPATSETLVPDSSGASPHAAAPAGTSASGVAADAPAATGSQPNASVVAPPPGSGAGLTGATPTPAGGTAGGGQINLTSGQHLGGGSSGAPTAGSGGPTGGSGGPSGGGSAGPAGGSGTSSGGAVIGTSGTGGSGSSGSGGSGSGGGSGSQGGTSGTSTSSGTQSSSGSQGSTAANTQSGQSGGQGPGERPGEGGSGRERGERSGDVADPQLALMAAGVMAGSLQSALAVLADLRQPFVEGLTPLAAPTQFGSDDQALAPMPAGMSAVFVKPLLPGESDAFALGVLSTVRGLVYLFDQVAQLRTPDQLHRALGLGFTVSVPGVAETLAYDPAATSIEVLRFNGVRPQDLVIPIASGVTPGNQGFRAVVRDHARPWLGTGEAPGSTSAQPIEEFEILGELGLAVPHLAEIWRLHNTGAEEHVATFNARTGRWSHAPAPTQEWPGQRVESGILATMPDGFVFGTVTLTDTHSVLIAHGPGAPESFQPAHDGSRRAIVSNGHITSLVGVATIGQWYGARVQVLHRQGDALLIDYADVSRGQANSMGFFQISQGHWQPRWVPVAEVTGVHAEERSYPLPQPAPQTAGWAE